MVGRERSAEASMKVSRRIRRRTRLGPRLPTSPRGAYSRKRTPSAPFRSWSPVRSGAWTERAVSSTIASASPALFRRERRAFKVSPALSATDQSRPRMGVWGRVNSRASGHPSSPSRWNFADSSAMTREGVAPFPCSMYSRTRSPNGPPRRYSIQAKESRTQQKLIELTPLLLAEGFGSPVGPEERGGAGVLRVEEALDHLVV